ncbi:MAG: hypothetical protein GIW99_00135 [Candidatus Eremiobacteraeota bacterium]|nr:hypothetical protein [Candidatus Eremiobacteraeota bacterium]MBC5826095.1 hypothetical protein [Candidatus Eremiobacteraeota bacterium]
MGRNALAVTVAATLLLAWGATNASADGAFTISVPALVQPPSMNGTIDESWSKAVKVPVGFDFTYQRPGEPTTAYIVQDSGALDVAFAVTQREQIAAAQATNGSGVSSDDHVTVVFWPQGSDGFSYAFSANPLGVRYQTSSENTAYSPEWTSVGKRTSSGYVVTMRIPFAIMRSGGSADWKVQFERTTIANDSVQVWEHVQGQRNPGQAAYGGTLTGIHRGAASSPITPKPRLQLYGLGEAAPAAIGGTTSRTGVDAALPVTATSSLLASFHPDYSNLEIDQQSIAPTAFARRYSEVRPFFTQAGTNFNFTFSCTNCPTTLYTPAIPAFRQGYSYEGTSGHFSYGAFDAIGQARSDHAQTLNYNLSNPREEASVALQRVAVDTPFLHDDTSTIDTGYVDQRTHLFAYFNGGSDRGSNVADPGFGDYFEYGGGFVDKTTTAVLSLQKVGAYFNPADGYVTQPDVAGYFAVYNRTLNFSVNAPLHDISLNSYYGRYHDRFGRTDQTSAGGQVNFDSRKLLTLHLFAGSSGVEPFYEDVHYLPFPTPYELLPFNSNGFLLGYKMQTSTPTSVTHSGGTYFHGNLGSWSYLTTLPVRRAVKLALEVDRNAYAPNAALEPAWQRRMGAEPSATQSLERASIDWQFNRSASLDFGLRRIVGRNIPNAFQFPDLPAPAPSAPCSTIAQAPQAVSSPSCYKPFDYVDSGNASFAFHFLAAQNEFYVVYGNPNSLSTYPALYLKWIRYIGAGKGT